MPTYYKDSADVLDYSLDWAAIIPTDTIATSTWTPPTGITAAVPSIVGKITTIWLTGGTTGTTYPVVNRVVTAGGRTIERTIHIRVKDQ